MPALTPEQLKEMVRMRRHGATPSEIARHFDVTPQAIDYRLRTSRARLMDDEGALHPVTGPLPERIRAVVWLRPKQETAPPPARAVPAATPDIRETVRAQVARIAAGPCPERRAKISLTDIPSSMELRAASWKGNT